VIPLAEILQQEKDEEMPNKNYIKGRRKEYKVCNIMKTLGYQIAQRSAGSHSPVDIFAINWITRKIKLIQCKPDTMSMKSIRKLLDENDQLNGTYEVEFEVR
jgi:hypothetical protein